MEKKKFISREVKIGIVVIIAIGMLYFGLNYLKGVNIFKPDTYFYAKYDRVDGIVKLLTSMLMVSKWDILATSFLITQKKHLSC